MIRVDYALEGRTTFAYTSLLSVSELVLRSPRGLEPGQSIELTPSLGSKDKPVLLQGTVGASDDEGSVPIAFAPGQDRALKQVRGYVEQQCVAKLEETVAETALTSHPKG